LLHKEYIYKSLLKERIVFFDDIF